MKRMKWWVFLGALLLLIGVAGVITDKFPFLTGASALMRSDVVFQENASGMTYEEAQETYRKAAKAMADQQYTEALELFKTIEGPYVRLQPMILIHQAQAHAELGDEGQAQGLLKKVIAAYDGTIIEALAQYRLGQSASRGGQPEVARQAFGNVVELAPESSVAAGSHYYLGQQLADRDPEAASEHYRAYLESTTNGTFSLVSAKTLERITPKLTPQDHLLIGQAFFYHDNFPKAVAHLKQAPFHEAWFPLGQATLKLGKFQEGQAHLEKGLKLASTKQEEAEEAIRLIYWNTPASQRVAKLKSMAAVPGLKGKDFVFWQLEQLSSGPAQLAYAKQLVTQHPESNWAPESSWLLIWSDFKAGRHADFVTRAENHLDKYPNSRSAPRAMFWLAKHYEKNGSRAKALEMFRELPKKYPNQFYAYRARQIAEQVENPWHTSPERPYPPAETAEVDAEALAKYMGNDHLTPVVSELINIQAVQDVELLSHLVHNEETPPPIDSWILQNKGDYAKSIRVIRDYLDDQRLEGKTVSDPNLYKLLYPVLFSEEIRQYARANRLDPYLVQALARQESYFNPVAVSSSNAMGLMQLLPSTAGDVAQWEKLGSFQATQLFQPGMNVRLGTRYLRFLHDKFNGNSMLSVGAYNGGPGAMSRWVQSSGASLQSDPDLFIENIPYGQSRDYIKEVYSHYWNYQELYQDEERLSAFPFFGGSQEKPKKMS